MESKGLFGASDNYLSQEHRKSALEVPIIEEFMRRAMCRSRWCPHNRNAAGAMPQFKGAHSEPLFALLRTGMYTLKGEKNELADRASQRQTGTVPRHKVLTIRAARTFFVHTPHRVWGISFWCTIGRSHVECCFCYSVIRPCFMSCPWTFRLEGPWALLSQTR